MAKLVQLTVTEGKAVRVQTDAPALLDEEEHGKTTLYFHNPEIPFVVIRGFAEQVIEALKPDA